MERLNHKKLRIFESPWRAPGLQRSGEKELAMELITDHACMVKPPWKVWGLEFRALVRRVLIHTERNLAHPKSTGTEAPAWASPSTSSSDCYPNPLSYPLIYWSISAFLWVFWELLQQINWTWGGGLRDLQFVVKSDRSCGYLRTYYF